MGQMSHHHRAAIKRHEAVVVTVKKKCDFCMQSGHLEDADFDGKTVYGPWANMCESHFMEYGVGLGLGRGQRLLFQEYDPDEKKA